MAKDKKETKDKGAGAKLLDEQVLYQELSDHFSDSDDYVSEVRSDWDEKEALFTGDLKDDLSTKTAKSKVFDPRLSTIVLERAARVMGQLPTGEAMAVSKDDKGKNMLMNLTIDKYALPNASSQFDYLIKSRMMDVYSMIYGVMFGLVDWRIDKKSGYVGPDLWLIPIRDAFPQAGAISIEESDRFQVANLVTDKYLKTLDEDTWQHIDEVLDTLKDDEGGKSRSDMDSERTSHIESERHSTGGGNFFELRTEYRTYGGKENKGEWITYSPDLDGKILRRIDNPHNNGELPIVAKYAFPLMDSIFGLGEFERGKSLQYAINSLINLYLDGVKMSLFPPTMINPDGVVPSSIKWQPAAKWLVRSPDAVQQLKLNPQGLATFQSTYSFLNAALLNQAGTTDTSVSDTTDPGLGKTPQALKMLAARESSRDNWDRFMMEKTQENILGKFVNLISMKQETPITLRLFKEEIEEIAQTYPDVEELVSMGEGSERGELSIKTGTFESTDFDYQIVSGSTAKADEQKQSQNLSQMFSILVENPGIIERMNTEGKDVNISELFTRLISSSGIPDWDKIVTDFTPEEQQQGGPQQQNVQGRYQDPEIQQVAQALMGQSINDIPPENVQ